MLNAAEGCDYLLHTAVEKSKLNSGDPPTPHAAEVELRLSKTQQGIKPEENQV